MELPSLCLAYNDVSSIHRQQLSIKQSKRNSSISSPLPLPRITIIDLRTTGMTLGFLPSTAVGGFLWHPFVNKRHLRTGFVTIGFSEFCIPSEKVFAVHATTGFIGSVAVAEAINYQINRINQTEPFHATARRIVGTNGARRRLLPLVSAKGMVSQGILVTSAATAGLPKTRKVHFFHCIWNRPIP